MSNVDGLQPTGLFAHSACSLIGTPQEPFVQILNFNGNHWICVSNVGSKCGEVNIFDSLHTQYTSTLLSQQIAWMMFCCDEKVVLNWPVIKKQKGSDDCGLFAIANAVALCYGMDPTDFDWDQKKMRAHLAYCFKVGEMKMFPTVTHQKPFTMEVVETSQVMPIYCHCRQPGDGEKMIACDDCGVYYHQSCESVPATAWENSEVLFFCKNCTLLNM